MNFGTNPYDVAFLLLAPVIALATLLLKHKWQVVAALVIAAFAGWGLQFAAEGWIDGQWTALFARTLNPSIRFLEQFNADGASKAAVALFGLPVSLLYALMCFGIARVVRRLVRRRVHA